MPPKMPWGKYKGDLLSDVPSAYIVWLLDNAKVSDDLLARELATEIIRRMEEYRPSSGGSGSYEIGRAHV